MSNKWFIVIGLMAVLAAVLLTEYLGGDLEPASSASNRSAPSSRPLTAEEAAIRGIKAP